MRFYLMDILISIRLIQSYTDGITWEAFSRSTQLQDSVIRRIGIIGEAARRISPRMREHHRQIPWNEMIGMRNRMIHEYDEVDLPDPDKPEPKRVKRGWGRAERAPSR